MSRSFREHFENIEKKTIEREVSIKNDITRDARAHPSTPLYYPDFPNGRLVVNMWAARKRIASALGVKRSELVDLLAEAVDDEGNITKVEEAPVKENVLNDFDLEKLPIPQYYPKDGGRYITSGVVFSEYEGKRNLSFHRMMLRDERSFTIRLVPRDLHTMYKKAKEKGEELEIAIAIGMHPSFLLAGATSVDYEKDELDIASALKRRGENESLEITSLDNGLSLPANAEYILQGRITREEDDEGPFVDITSTYDEVRQQPVVRIDKIYHRNDPIFHALLPGGNEHFLLMGLPRESVIKKKISDIAPVKNVRLTEGGCSWLHGVVSLEKDSDIPAKEIIDKAFGAHTSMKKVTIVDPDIDIYNDKEVEWALATRFQPDEDLYIYKDKRGSSLDPSAPDLTSKWGLDATVPEDLDEEDFKKAEMD